MSESPRSECGECEGETGVKSVAWKMKITAPKWI